MKMSQTDITIPPSFDRSAQCLILAAAGRSVPSALRDGLRSRSVICRQIDGPIRMMVELARHPSQAVILIEPDTLPQSGRLIDAVQRYHPGAVLWRYAEGPEPILQVIQPPRVPVEPAASPPSLEQPAEQRHSTIDGTVEIKNITAESFLPPDGDISSAPLISDEELAMLLDLEDMGEDQP